MGSDQDDKDMDNMRLEYDRDCHWRVVFKENDVEVNDEESIIHDNRWGLYLKFSHNTTKRL